MIHVSLEAASGDTEITMVTNAAAVQVRCQVGPLRSLPVAVGMRAAICSLRSRQARAFAVLAARPGTASIRLFRTESVVAPSCPPFVPFGGGSALARARTEPQGGGAAWPAAGQAKAEAGLQLIHCLPPRA